MQACLLKLYVEFGKLCLKSQISYQFFTPMMCVGCFLIAPLSGSPKIKTGEKSNHGVLGATILRK